MIIYVALLISLLGMLYWWWLERPFNQPRMPEVIYQDAEKGKSPPATFCRRVTDAMPILRQIYNPPLLWGRNGHVQTFVYGVYDRVDAKRPHGTHCTIRASDGATIIYDIYERKLRSSCMPNPRQSTSSSGSSPAKQRHRSTATSAAVAEQPDVTLLICPGIANSSLSPYISTFVYYAQHVGGYRCAVLNHLGSERYTELTAPRIFSYGGTADFELMLIDMLRRHPTTHFILVGFSMGGNVVTKFLGLMTEQDRISKHIIAAVSACQGYDIAKAMYQYMSSWENLGKLYNYLLCVRMRQVLARHETVLVGHAAMKRNPDSFEKMKHFTSLADIDRIYSMHVQDRGGSPYESLDEFYRDMSSITNLNSVRNFPVMFVNAQDDPIIPLHLVRDQIEQYCRAVNERAMLVITRHGGHLGFFDSAIGVDELHKHVTSVNTCLFQASKFNWLDRLILQYCDAVVAALDADGTVEFDPDLTPLRPSSVRRRRRRSREGSGGKRTAAPANTTPSKQKKRRRRRKVELVVDHPAATRDDILSDQSSFNNAEVNDADVAAAADAVNSERKDTLTNLLQSDLPNSSAVNNPDADDTSRSSSRNSNRSSSSAGGDVEDADEDDDDGFDDDDDDDGSSSVATGTNCTGSVSAYEEFFLDDEFLRAHSSTVRKFGRNADHATQEAAEVAPQDVQQKHPADVFSSAVSTTTNHAEDKHVEIRPLATAADHVTVITENVEPQSSSLQEKDVERSGTLLLVDDDTGQSLVAVSTVEEDPPSSFSGP